MTDARDPFQRLTAPRAPLELRERVLRAAAGAPDQAPLLDRLWASRAWWLSCGATMLVLLALQARPTPKTADGPDLRRWRERLQQVELELERPETGEPAKAGRAADA